MERTIGIAFDSKTSLQTPLYAIYTRGGVVPNITIDILEDILQGPHALSVNFFDLYANDTVIASYKQKTNKSLKDFLCMQKHFFLMELGDNFSKGIHNKCTDSSLYGETAGGVKKLAFSEFYKSIATYDLEYFTSLCDKSSIKDKNPTFLNLTRKGTDSIQNSKMIVPFVGGKNRPTQDRFVEFVKGIDNKSGAISFDQIAESPKETFELLKFAIPLLEKNKIVIPRILNGSDHPKMILESVAHGIDVFTGKFPFLSAEFGYALVFPLDLVDQECDMHLNLREMKFETSPEPLFKGCQCLTCRDHTRAYIHHLLNTKEMTGDVLLSM